MTTRIGVDVFDCYDSRPTPFRLDEAVNTGPSCPEGLYRLRMDGVTFYILPDRLRELAALILDKFPLVAPPLAEHTPEEIADAVQWEGAVSI